MPLTMAAHIRSGVLVTVLSAFSALLAGGCTPSAGHQPTASSPPSAQVGFGARIPETEVEQATFRTPSKNIVCLLNRDSVRCDIGRKSWTPPAKPTGCQLDWGHGAFIDAGKAGVTCAGDSLLGEPARLLDYGTGLRSGDVSCESESTGLRCADERTGHGFTLAMAEYELF
jgi:uncharacterized protein DUF6636